MIKLTARQQQILDLIRDSIEQTGFPPTRAEIAQILGFRSANAAEEHLRALARKDVIELSPGTSRGIRLKQKTPIQLMLPHPKLAQLELPLIGRVAAGSPLLSTEHIESYIPIAGHFFRSVPDYLLKVRGLSMRDAGILNGDLLAVRQSKEARNGQIIVARLGQEVTVKRFYQYPSHIELVAENPDFPTITVIPDEDHFELEGLAVGLLRSYLE